MYAVGWSQSAATFSPLILHWNGSSWSLVSGLPSISQTSVRLYGVAAISASNVWAVGAYFNDANSSIQTLALHWDGSSWTVIPTPSPGLLYSVSANSPSDVWAVGATSVGGPLAALALHWDGSSWTSVPVPSPGTGNVLLTSVAGSGSDDAWSVGFRDGGGSLSPVAEHWDGSDWSTSSLPSFGGVESRLLGVTDPAPGDAWAVGSSLTPRGSEIAGPSLGIIAHWDGTSWDAVQADHSGKGSDNTLFAIAQAPDLSLWSTGTVGAPATMVERVCPVLVGQQAFGTTSVRGAIGRDVVWTLAPGASSGHAVQDGTGLGLFSSPTLTPPVASYTHAFTAAGSYTVTDPGDAALMTVAVPLLVSPATGTQSTAFQVTWASAAATSPLVYDVQIERPGTTAFTSWQSAVSSAQATFAPDAGTGTYLFHARVRNRTTGAKTGWGPSVSITVS